MLYHPKAIKRLSTHSGRLERWLGAERLEQLSHNFLNGGGQGIPWYGPPINLADVPGSVWIGGDGDFTGDLGRGFFASAADSLADHLRRLWRGAGKPVYLREPQFGAGFSSIADAVLKARTGYRQYPEGNIAKTSITGFANSAETLWSVGTNPAAGAAASAAPGGRVPTKATTGAMWFNNPSAGTLHLTGADFSASVINTSLMLYDRIFDVDKQTGSTAAEAVTGVPTRYQSTTATDEDYIGGNFCFIEATGLHNATPFNWTVCQYTDEAGNAGQNFQSVLSLANTPAGTFVLPAFTWFLPLDTGDTGVKELTQMQRDGTGGGGASCQFVLAHSIGVMMFPQINDLIPFDWLTVRNLAPRIFDDACLALFELPKPSTAATIYTGTIQVVNAP